MDGREEISGFSSYADLFHRREMRLYLVKLQTTTKTRQIQYQK